MATPAQETSFAPLTPARIAALKPGDDESDAATGLRVRVSQGGTKSFRTSVRTSEGRQRWITLGHWSPTPKPGHLTLSQARDWIDRLKESRRTSPEHFAAVEAELRTVLFPTEAPTAPNTPLLVKTVAADFLGYIERRRTRPEHVRGPMEFDVISAIGERPITEVTTIELRQIVEGAAQGTAGVGKKGPRTRPAPRQAGVVHALLKQFFDFAYKRGDIDRNPMERLDDAEMLGAEQNICQRRLSAHEIRAFWNAMDAYPKITPTVRDGLKILLLTSVRTCELLKGRVEHVDFDNATWVIPVANQKLSPDNRKIAKPWIIPLAPMALGFLRELAALAKAMNSPMLMASFHSSSSGAGLTQKALVQAMRRFFEGPKPILQFDGDRPTPHDLRRTVRTGLGELGVPWHVAERCLNHSLGKIANTYDVGDYLAERRAALEKWERHLASLLVGAEVRAAS